MAASKTFQDVVRSTKYPEGAFNFVARGLEFTVLRVHGEAVAKTDLAVKHVDGRTLCMGLRDYAIDQYGLLARTVLARWRITKCKDFGEIVFAMVDAGLMRKTDNDSIRDFMGVYEFNDAFAPSLNLSAHPPQSPGQKTPEQTS